MSGEPATAQETRVALAALAGAVCERCGVPTLPVVLDLEPKGLCMVCVVTRMIERLNASNAELAAAIRANTP